MTNVVVERARRMHREKTPAERRLWRALRELNRQGFNFRQQAPIGPCIADFVDHSTKLVIEVDGGHHGEDNHRQRDDVRTDWQQSQGYRVVRFWNGDVLRHLDGVMSGILIALGVVPQTEPGPRATAPSGDPPMHDPSPQGGGETECAP